VACVLLAIAMESTDFRVGNSVFFSCRLRGGYGPFAVFGIAALGVMWLGALSWFLVPQGMVCLRLYGIPLLQRKSNPLLL